MVDFTPKEVLNNPKLGETVDTTYPPGFLDSLNKPHIFADPKSKTQIKTVKERQYEAIKYAVPNVILGAFSEIAASLPGISDEEVETFLKSSTPDGIFQQFKKNQEGAKTAGAIATSLVPIFGITKIMKSEKLFNSATKIIGESATKLLLPSKLSMMDRVAKIKEEAALLATKQQISFSAMAEPAIVNKLRKEVLHEVFDNLKIGVATDLGIYATLNESDFFFPDEMSAVEIAAFYGVPNLVIAGVGGAMMRYQIKNALRDIGPVAAKERNKAGMPFGDIFSREGHRDIAAITYAAQRNIKETEFAKIVDDPVLAKNVNSQKRALDTLLGQQFHLMAQDSPIPGITKSAKLSEGAFNTLQAASKSEHNVVAHTISIENYSNAETILKNTDAAKTTIENKLKKITTELPTASLGTPKYGKLIKEQRELLEQQKTLDELSLVKLNPDGSMALAQNLKESFDDIATGVERKTSAENVKPVLERLRVGDIVEINDKVTDLKMYAAKFDTGKGVKYVTTTNELKVIFPETQTVKAGVEGVSETVSHTFENLTFKGKTAAQATMRHAVDKFEIPEKLTSYIAPKSTMHHLELDGILEIGDKLGRDNQNLHRMIQFDSKDIKNFDDIEFASLTSKYREWVKLRNMQGAFNTGKIKLPANQKPTLEDMIIELNLPNNGTTGPQPLTRLFDDLYVGQVNELSEVFPTLDSLKNTLIKQTVPQGDIVGKFIQPNELMLRGTQLKTFTETRKPVLLVQRAPYYNPLQREEIVHAAMQERAMFIDGMKNARNERAPLISELTDEALRDEIRLTAAKQIDSVVDGSQIRGDAFTQAMHGLENQSAIVAMDSIRGAQDNIRRSYTAAKFEPFNMAFNRIISHENKGDLLSFEVLVNQNGLGWRGLPDFIPVENGGKLIGYKIALEDHQFNKDLFARMYPDEVMPESLFMPNPKLNANSKYSPLVISPKAADVATAFNTLDQDVLTHNNYLRKLMGKPPIARRDFHLPAKNLKGKELIYLINKDTGQIQSIKSGNTPKQVRNLAEEEIASASKQGMDLFIATETEIANYPMLKLQAFEAMSDYSSSLTQTGPAKGTSFGQIIETGPEIVTRMQETIINQYDTISKITNAMLFEPQLKQAEFMARTIGLTSSQLKKGKTIYNAYINRALSNKSGSRERVIGQAYGATEDIYDKIVQTIWDEKVSVFKGTKAATLEAKSGFDALDKAVPDYNPFKDSVEFLENTMKVHAPHNMKKHVAKINNLVSLTMLRMFEVGLGLINIGALPSLIPSVSKALAKMPGETTAKHLARVGAWSSPIKDDVVLWNPMRTFTSGMHYTFSLDPLIAAERKKVLEMAAKKGHLWQEIVEKMQLFTAPAEGYSEKMIKHYAELSSKIVDKTEQWSRSISYLTFYNMGKKSLLLGDEAAMEFAHRQANQVIGDFRPNVRPQIFQGAPGAAAALFTTFAWNYLQRVFGYLEKGQFKAFANQMGLQAAFFGAKSLPGFNQYVEHFTSNYDGSENLIDRLDKNFGSAFTDGFLFGGVGKATGLAWHTRADVGLPFSNYRQGSSVLDFAAATSFVKQTFRGIAETVDSLKTNRGFNSQQLTEIASRTFPVSGLRGIFELAAGQTVDSRGQIIDAHISGATDVFSRLSKIKTLRNQRVIDEFSRERSIQLKQNEIRASIRKALRSAFRAGKLDGDFLNSMAHKYIKSGGEPAGWPGFIKDEMFAGLVDKTYLRALETARSNSKQKDFIRLMDIIADD